MHHFVIAYPGNDVLAASLAAESGARLLPLEHRRFPDGETYLRVAGDVKGAAVVVACGLEQPDAKMVGLYLLASTLRDLGARSIVLAAPYLGYMRQDRIFREGEGVTARYFARLLSGFVDGLVTVDPHLHRVRDLQDVYSIPTRAVAAAPEISRWLARNVDAPVLIGPDLESEQWVSQIAERAQCPFVVLEKTRRDDRSVEVSLPDLAPWRDRTPVLIDDIISTAGTMIAAAHRIKAVQHRPPVCLAVHAIFAGAAYEQLRQAGAATIVTCNTIPHATNAIDVHPAITHAVLELLPPDAPSERR